MLNNLKTLKNEVIKMYQVGTTDTGSPRVQIALLTQRINYLTEHFKKHKKDFSGKKGLLRIVGQRRRLIDYLKKTDDKGYKKLKKDLNI